MATSCSPFTGEDESGILRVNALAGLSGVGKLCMQGHGLSE